jgi:hypothetical protein
MRALAPLFGLLLAGVLSGCAISDDASMAQLLVTPGQYTNYTCDDIADEQKKTAQRERDLKNLIVQSEGNGSVGWLVSSTAYRPEYLSAVGELNELQRAAVAKKCDPPPSEVNYLSDTVIR